MKLFAIYQYSHLLALCETKNQVFAYLRDEYSKFCSNFNNQHGWTRQHYVSASNFAAQNIRFLKVLEIDTTNGVVMNTPPQHSSFVDVTGEFFVATEARYEGVSKMFAEVKNPRAKSFGMTVVVDPQHYGDNVRPVEEYEAMIGTFAKIKASTNIEGYGYAHLTFAPESLTNFRIETQMITGWLLNWVE